MGQRRDTKDCFVVKIDFNWVQAIPSRLIYQKNMPIRKGPQQKLSKQRVTEISLKDDFTRGH